MTERFRLSIPRAIYDAMLAHVQSELPAEGCGQLGGKVVDGIGRVTLHLPMVNALSSPTEFVSDAASTLAAHKALRASGTDVLAVYHSHPTSDPVPSQRDLERNYSESVVNIIIGLRGPEPDVRAWWLTADGAQETDWVLGHDDTGCES
jgi:[CysO sulfur-carrier protein]-S-L-cysteine hydrolase